MDIRANWNLRAAILGARRFGQDSNTGVTKGRQIYDVVQNELGSIPLVGTQMASAKTTAAGGLTATLTNPVAMNAPIFVCVAASSPGTDPGISISDGNTNSYTTVVDKKYTGAPVEVLIQKCVNNASVSSLAVSCSVGSVNQAICMLVYVLNRTPKVSASSQTRAGAGTLATGSSGTIVMSGCGGGTVVSLTITFAGTSYELVSGQDQVTGVGNGGTWDIEGGGSTSVEADCGLS
jgi:hypothetical protein